MKNKVNGDERERQGTEGEGGENRAVRTTHFTRTTV